MCVCKITVHIFLCGSCVVIKSFGSSTWNGFFFTFSTLTVMHPVCVSSTGFTQPREPLSRLRWRFRRLERKLKRNWGQQRPAQKRWDPTNQTSGISWVVGLLVCSYSFRIICIFCILSMFSNFINPIRPVGFSFPLHLVHSTDGKTL